WLFVSGWASSLIASWGERMRCSPRHRTRADRRGLLCFDQRRRLRGGLRLELLHQIKRLATLLFQTPVIGFHDRAIAAVIGIGIGAALRSAENGNDDLLDVLRHCRAAARDFVITDLKDTHERT